MKLLLLALALAGELVLPPAKYDKPYRGKLTTVVVPLREVERRCEGKAWACQYWGARGHCVIVLPGDVNRRWFLLLRRHEIGHCNGWGGNHSGMRKAH